MAETHALPDRLHHLLLGFAGRVDDDALASARELVAVAEPDRAVELLVGCLLAGRIPVTSGEQYQLRRLLDVTASEPTLVERLAVLDESPTDPHRFSSRNDGDEDVRSALRSAAARVGGVRSVRTTWRTTPAGATPGRVPQRVLLVEIEHDGFAAATAYQMTNAVRQAGSRAAVEVYRAGEELPEYHRRALEASMPVVLDGRAPADTGPEPAGAERHNPRRQGYGDYEDNPRSSEPPAVDDLPEPEVLSVRTDEPRREQPARLPAAVDSRLTERERGLLQRLHEELEQRERDDRPETSGWQLSGEMDEGEGEGRPAGGPELGAPNGYPPLGSSSIPPTP
ncbi:hypothetical protein GCM10012275_40300 [Longimycelium tulufanense]|uniref:Uncharacterized protein n=1 Tax=Longimycelium tulufanense TaxID=907463 RepID=A0A8J3CGX3_9PSEU|nr:hypothetical protein [Longimycelium tulufanense]GGM65671.1 hypothetical protein GCM10012275_40300 [Longimycelium tulufanense]